MAKTPPSLDNARHCPLLNRGCIGQACAWWIEMYGVDEAGKPVLDKECSIPWLAVLGREQLIETARTAAGHDKVASETRLLSSVIDGGLRQQRELANGG